MRRSIHHTTSTTGGTAAAVAMAGSDRQTGLVGGLGKIAQQADDVIADRRHRQAFHGLLQAQLQDRGLIIGEGLGMLLHHAVRGFSLWFGVTPQVTHDLRHDRRSIWCGRDGR